MLAKSSRCGCERKAARAPRLRGATHERRAKRTAVSPDDTLAEFLPRIARWREHGPALFAAEALGLPPKWDDEKKEGIRKWWWRASHGLVTKRKISVRSGHGAHKTGFTAVSILWFLVCYHPCKIPCTAPSSHQLHDVLWPEIAKWLRRLRDHAPALAEAIEWTKNRVSVREAPEEGFAVLRTARPEKPEALQGFHSDNLLFVVDEASGVAEPVFEVAQGALLGKNAFLILIGNPTRTHGFFYESHHKDRAAYTTIHVDVERVEGANTQEVERLAKKYGRESNYFRVRVQGEFPQGELDTLIPLYICEESQARWSELEDSGQIVWGLDPAGQGTDRTVLFKRSGTRQLEPHKAWRQLEAMQVVGRVHEEWLNTAPEARPVAICVDAIGLGSGIASRLSELKLPVVAVNVSELPAMRAEYHRLRDELYWKVREWLMVRKSALHPQDDEVVGELTLLHWKPPESDGKVRIEAKHEVKKRLKTESSPDVADAVMLSFAHFAPVEGGVVAGSAMRPADGGFMDLVE